MSVGRLHQWDVLLPALATVAIAATATVTLPAEADLSRRDADQLKQKVAAIAQFGERPSQRTLRTMLTENEVNAYLAYDATEGLPAGVVEPSVTILGTGRLSGRAVVDLDAVRKQKNPSSLFDPVRFLGGRLPITATGALITSNGVGRFQLESAAIGGLPVPKTVLQEILSYYSRTPQSPAGINLDDPFPLPARIREIRVERGQAVVVQ
jgi:hypothetical protein